MRRAAAVQPGINQQSLKQKLKSYRHQPLSLILLILTLLSAVLTVGVLVCLIGSDRNRFCYLSGRICKAWQ